MGRIAWCILLFGVFVLVCLYVLIAGCFGVDYLCFLFCFDVD